MKIDKLSIDGKKTSIEVKDNIFSSKINETLISDDKFNDLIKLIHFTTSRNKPHECELFSHLYTWICINIVKSWGLETSWEDSYS